MANFFPDEIHLKNFASSKIFYSVPNTFQRRQTTFLTTRVKRIFQKLFFKIKFLLSKFYFRPFLESTGASEYP